MALIEVEEGEIRKLQTQLAAANPSKIVLDRISSDPKTRARVLELIKEVSPQTPIPEIDATKPILAELNALKAELANDRKARAEADSKRETDSRTKNVENTIASERKKLRKSGYSDESIKAIEDVMEERGLADYDAASALFERDRPRDEESILPSSYGRNWDLFETSEKDDETIRKAISLPKGAAQERALSRWTSGQVNDFMRELRGNRARA